MRRGGLTQVYFERDRVRWSTVADLAPTGQRINSPYDPWATFGNKRSMTWTGHKVHVTETCESGRVHLITNLETTLARTGDVDLTASIHAALAAKGLCGGSWSSRPGFRLVAP